MVESSFSYVLKMKRKKMTLLQVSLQKRRVRESGRERWCPSHPNPAPSTHAVNCGLKVPPFFLSSHIESYGGERGRGREGDRGRERRREVERGGESGRERERRRERGLAPP